MTFSKMPPRTSVPTGVTKGKPGSAPAASHNRTNKELQMTRITVAFLADQAAAQNVRMDRLMATVESLVGIVAAVLPTAPVAVAAAAPVPPVVAAAAQVAAAADDAVTRRNTALARGRATAAANRAARKGTSAPAAPVAAPVSEPVAAAAPAAVKVTPLTRARINGTVVHKGTIGGAAYVVAWNRTAAAWDWQFSYKGKTSKGQVPNGDAARAVAFRALNKVAAASGAAQVRAGK